MLSVFLKIRFDLINQGINQPICDTNPKQRLFIYMDKLTKHLCIRLTETQFKTLADILVDEHISKSQLVRNVIYDYLKTYHYKELMHNKISR